MCTLRLSGCRVEAPAASGPPGLHTTARELQTCTFQEPGASNTPKIKRKDPKREKKRKQENCGGRGKNKGEISGPPTLRSPPPFGHLTLRGPHPSGPPPFGALTFSGFGPPPFGAPALRGRTDCETTKTLILAKNGLAKSGRAQNTMAKNGLAQNGLVKYDQIRMAKKWIGQKRSLPFGQSDFCQNDFGQL